MFNNADEGGRAETSPGSAGEPGVTQVRVELARASVVVQLGEGGEGRNVGAFKGKQTRQRHM